MLQGQRDRPLVPWLDTSLRANHVLHGEAGAGWKREDASFGASPVGGGGGVSGIQLVGVEHRLLDAQHEACSTDRNEAPEGLKVWTTRV